MSIDKKCKIGTLVLFKRIGKYTETDNFLKFNMITL